GLLEAHIPILVRRHVDRPQTLPLHERAPSGLDLRHLCGESSRFQIWRWAPTWRVVVSALLDHPFDHSHDPTESYAIRLDRRPVQPEQARSVWSRPDRRRAPGYGSGGWGFESLAARPTPQVSRL